MALNWIKKESPSTDTVICSDSQSLLTAIDNYSPETHHVRELLNSLKGRTTLQWVRGHINIPGNELADKAAKDATKIDSAENPKPIKYNTAVSIINYQVKDPAPQHLLVSKTYKHISQNKDSTIKNRKDSATLAQLRSGHCNLLAAYQHRLDENKSALCKKCTDEDETTKHWLGCPATIQTRIQFFGDSDVDLGALTKYPIKALAFAKATLY